MKTCSFHHGDRFSAVLLCTICLILSDLVELSMSIGSRLSVKWGCRGDGMALCYLIPVWELNESVGLLWFPGCKC